MTPRLRIDRLLVERGFFDSRAKAQAAIAAGLVRADGEIVRKASDEIVRDAAIQAEPAHPYVSRGGLKLAAALDAFGFDPKGRACLDVGRGQLHESLRARPEVVSLEQTDVRSLSSAGFQEKPDLVTIDVSFISLRHVLPAALSLVQPAAQLVALIKPQFEAGRETVRKGIVRDTAVHQAVCDRIAALVLSLGWHVAEILPSPIQGGDGNTEFLLGATHD
jgi:23S rRNA (cytidine1920-2'-O)/16S rRNA (cytidine1409-2'-O)-methyltransferase